MNDDRPTPDEIRQEESDAERLDPDRDAAEAHAESQEPPDREGAEPAPGWMADAMGSLPRGASFSYDTTPLREASESGPTLTRLIDHVVNEPTAEDEATLYTANVVRNLRAQLVDMESLFHASEGNVSRLRKENETCTQQIVNLQRELNETALALKGRDESLAEGRTANAALRKAHETLLRRNTLNIAARDSLTQAVARLQRECSTTGDEVQRLQRIVTTRTETLNNTTKERDELQRRVTVAEAHVASNSELALKAQIMSVAQERDRARGIMGRERDQHRSELNALTADNLAVRRRLKALRRRLRRLLALIDE